MCDLEVDALSVENKTLKPNEVWKLGPSSQPILINLGTFTMEPGSRVEVENARLLFTCETLVRNGLASGRSGEDNFDFGIFGLKPPAPGVPEALGGPGGTPGPAQDGTCKCSGGVAGNNGAPGSPGGKGGEGVPGIRGNRGLPSLLAEISITKSLEGNSQLLVIKSRGGDGGEGGKGGKGGPGGTGGLGGNGVRCAGACTAGGNGGRGGTGGNGGVGGTGGNGANAERVFVTVPPDAANRVTGFSEVSEPGGGGTGGDPGDPGEGGEGGRGIDARCPAGNKGGGGAPGTPGFPGKDGNKGGLAGRITINGVD